MFAEERLQEITKILNANGKVIVKDLSKIFEVTDDCIRKDLSNLEKTGILKRTYGGAVSKREASLNKSIINRIDDNIKSKKMIAEKVYNMVNEKETIFLDIASTNISVAEAIAQGNKRITVISNMIDIIQILSKSPYIEVIGIGGVLNKELSGFIGTSTIEALSVYKVDRAFVGSCGVDLMDHSVTTFMVEDGNTKKAIMKASKKSYLVIDSTKFNQDGVYRFADINDFDALIVDRIDDPKVISKLEEQNIEVL